MSTWVLISLIIINLASVVALWVIHRKMSHLEESHVHIIGEENRELVCTRKYRNVIKKKE